jgi:preprotein translocase subunit SecA
VGLTRFGRVVGNNQFQLDQESLANWASSRFDATISGTEAIGNTLNDVRAVLVKHSVASYEVAEAAATKAKEKVDQLYRGHDAKLTVKEASGGNGAIGSLANWFDENLKLKLEPETLAKFDQEALQRHLQQAIDDRYHPEIRRMERQVLLSIVDAAWKDHLLAMDHLRSAISLKSYAQMDPKVEYKREGMRMYGQMWFAIGERMTDLIFRMEHLDEDFVNSTWVETTARHDAPPSPIMQQQEEDLAAADRAGKSEPQRVEPIRNDGVRVGRNDPCPCGSGKKYKACHGRK